jgi:hypothetical protein
VSAPMPNTARPVTLPESNLTSRFGGVAEGTRTPDHRDHNPGLYRLSYRHRGRDSLAGANRRFAAVPPAATAGLV